MKEIYKSYLDSNHEELNDLSKRDMKMLETTGRTMKEAKGFGVTQRISMAG